VPFRKRFGTPQRAFPTATSSWAIGRPLLECAARAAPRIGSQGVGY